MQHKIKDMELKIKGMQEALRKMSGAAVAGGIEKNCCWKSSGGWPFEIESIGSAPKIVNDDDDIMKLPCAKTPGCRVVLGARLRIYFLFFRYQTGPSS